MNKAIPHNLRTKRKKLGWTQQFAAEKFKVKRSRYAAWEEGRAQPGLNYLTKMCELFDIDDLYLFISKKF